MLFDSDKNPEKEEKEDWFDNIPSAEEEPAPKEPKKPVFKPDDPAYWEQEESEWEHLKPSPRRKLWLWVAMLLVAGALVGVVYVRYFSPYVEEATQFGYVESIEKRGTVFETFEGVLIPYKELMDTTRVYQRDFLFTAENEKVAVMLKRMQYAARPVRVEYRKYHATVPWRGSSKIVVTAVDSVDPSKILPPEFAPEFVRQGKDGGAQ